MELSEDPDSTQVSAGVITRVSTESLAQLTTAKIVHNKSLLLIKRSGA